MTSSPGATLPAVDLCHPWVRVRLLGPSFVVRSLTAIFEPWLRPEVAVGGAGPPTITVRCHRAPGVVPTSAPTLVERLRGENGKPSRWIERHGRAGHPPAFRSGETGAWIRLEGGVVWVGAPTDEALVAEARDVIQRQVVHPAALNAGVMLHAAGLVRAGRALVLAGAKGAGKTTTQLRLMRRGWSPMAADRVVLSLVDDGVLADGYPARLSVRSALLPDDLADLSTGVPDGPEKVLVPLGALASRFGTEVAPRAPLAHLVVLDPRARGVEALDAGAMTGVLGEHVFEAATDPLVTLWLGCIPVQPARAGRHLASVAGALAAARVAVWRGPAEAVHSLLETIG